MSGIRWSNVPIPEGHAILLIIGILLHFWLPLTLIDYPWLIYVIGWLIMLLGLLLAAWAVVTAKGMEIAKPNKILTSGPYTYSRNPMYVAWTLIYLALALLVNTWWLILFLPALLIFTHYFVIRREERQMDEQFGEAYRQYCGRVGRYL